MAKYIADQEGNFIAVDGRLITAPEGSGTDISLEISGASAGQILQIQDVSSDGVPLKWNAVAIDTLVENAETDPTIPDYIKNITEEDIQNWNSKGSYSKPAGGITTADLAKEVTDLLSAAGSAVQSEDLAKVATSGSYTDLSGTPDIPAKTSELINDSGFITTSDIPEGAAASTTSPKMDGTATVGTELAFARGDHVHPSDTSKVDKVEGKGLSTNDYTTEEKNKLASIAEGATAVDESTVSGWGFSKTTGTYSKPDGGIPATDLAKTVQDKLDLAESALQEFTESDPTVPSHVKSITAQNITDWNNKQDKIDNLQDIADGAAAGATALQPNDIADWAKAASKPTYTAAEVGALPSDTQFVSEVTTSNITSALGYTPADAAKLGTANGIAQLDTTGKVPAAQLPSYVDDVLEYNGKANFPASGESGIIYIDSATNITYRWGGSDYVAIGSDLALGETSSTAYAGDKGKANADAISSHTADTAIHTSTTEKNTWNAKYNKPEGGIPKSDLAEAVQTSLGLADSALQAVPDNYITEDSLDEILAPIRENISDIELFKFPNATIVGNPVIESGQVSNFSSLNYLIFPFVVDVHDKTFEIGFCFTTGNDITTQQNILDSAYGLAIAIKDGKGVMALSSDGQSFNLGQAVGTYSFETDKTYYAKITWDGSVYKTSISIDGKEYTEDMVINSASGLYPTTIYIGGSQGLFGAGTAHPFKGSINLNKCYLNIAGLPYWGGMDDAGIATRADISLSNIDSEGINKIRTIASVPSSGYLVRITYNSTLASEIQAILDAGNTPYIIYNNNTYYYQDISPDNYYRFVSITPGSTSASDPPIIKRIYKKVGAESGGWGNGTLTLYDQNHKPTASDVGALPNTTAIPSALSDLTDDATHRVVTDTEKAEWSGKQDTISNLSTIVDGAAAGATALQPGDLADWAKADNKPSYTATEVGALPSTTTIPTNLSDLTDDATHRVVTDTEKQAWNSKSNFSGNYNDLKGLPSYRFVDDTEDSDYLIIETYVE